ncbi:YciI family protein [Pseudonocardia nigra]|uniref:YciI family protein n=1 Tax=Pseudonocardia nigra TaxID=1921578 RepID=UPI001FEA9CAC|nr:YciI family protein [Pseudonocardia nigra]
MMPAYTNKAGWEDVDYSSAEFQAMCAFYEELGTELTASGELVLTEGLGEPALTRTIRRSDGGPVVSDGPYAESKEVLASFAILDCVSHDRALAIAARVVDAIGDTVEIRPIGGDPAGQQ